MNALDILDHLSDGKLTEEEAIAEMVKLGGPEDEARELMDIATGKSTGDIIS